MGLNSDQHGHGQTTTGLTDFLDILMILFAHPDISTASACNEQIRGLVNNCLDYLDSRAEFWRCQKPLYAREREKLEAKEGAKGADTTKFILQALEDIDRGELYRKRQIRPSSFYKHWRILIEVS